MIKIAVVLVEVDDQHGLAPDIRHGGEGIQRFLYVPGALHRARRAGVFRVGGRCHEPGHLTQLAIDDVLLEGLQEAAVWHGVRNAFVERVAGFVAGRVVGRGCHGIVVAHGLARRLIGLAVLLEAGERVVREVVRHVLVDEPAHVGFLQTLGVGLPGVAQGRGPMSSHSLLTAATLAPVGPLVPLNRNSRFEFVPVCIEQW